MGSLRNIMNVDDDHLESHTIRRDKRSGSGSTLEQDSSMIMARYSDYPAEYATDYATDYSSHSYSSRVSRRTSSPYSLHPSALPLGYSSTSGNRRRSNTSADSMESIYGHAQSHAGLHSNASRRPMTSAGVAGEHPVKLTPITGRVSRAKKGVPVHTCEICRPSKTFTRAEHLRRHQLSHQPPELACTVPGCDKVFHRKDLLERHQQRHEQDEKLSKDVGLSSRRSYTTAASPSRGHGSSPPMPSHQMQSPFGSSPHGRFASSIPEASHWSSVGKSGQRDNASTSPPHVREAHRAYPLDEMKNEYVVDSVPGLHCSVARMVPGYDEPRTSITMGVLSAMPNLCMTDPVSSGMGWPEGLEGLSSTSGSTYSSPPSDQQLPSRTPSAEWTGQMASFPPSSSPIMASGGYPLSFGYATTPPQVYATMYSDAMGLPLPGYEESTPSMYGAHHLLDTTVRSLSPPQLLIGPSSDTLVAAPAALPADRLMYPPRTLGREPVDALGLFMTQDMMSVNLSRETRSAIPSYLEVYWDKVHSMYPIIHRPTFESGTEVMPEHLDILQCAMAAVATQFLEHREHRNNGHQLHAYAWEKSRMYTSSQEWPLPVMQAVLLCEYYARFRGRSKKAYQPSLRFETLYQMVINMQNTNYAMNLSTCSEAQRWKAWVDAESRRRLLSACFLLDVHGMSYLEQPRVATLGLDYGCPETLPIALSVGTSRLWNAPSGEEWRSINDSRAAMLTTATVGSALNARVSAVEIAAIPAFDAALLQATHALRLPQRRSPTTMELVEDASGISVEGFDLVELFPYSPSVMTYLALHHTPLHTLLSVSGDSWVFNKKILEAGDFVEHQSELKRWRDSGSAAVAVAFAARALGLFLGLRVSESEKGHESGHGNGKGAQHREISDFWGVYVCALICWAFGHGRCRSRSRVRQPCRRAAMRWIADVAEMQPGQVQRLSERERQDGSGAVGLARVSLERDCLGGRSMLLADAVSVLKKLDEGDYRYF